MADELRARMTRVFSTLREQIDSMQVVSETGRLCLSQGLLCLETDMNTLFMRSMSLERARDALASSNTESST
jgi:hypothetical protein